MFDVDSIPKIIIIKQGKYYVLSKKVKSLEDITEFLNEGYKKYESNPLPERKSTWMKIWFLNKGAINLAISFLDSFGIEAWPYPLKVAALFALLLAPFIGIMIWALYPYSGPKLSKERKAQIFATMKEKIKQRREAKEDEEEDELDTQRINTADMDKVKSN